MNPSKVTVATDVTETTLIRPLTLVSTTAPIIVTDGHEVLEEPKLESGDPYHYKFHPQRLRELAEFPHIWATMYPDVLFMAFYRYYTEDKEFTFRGSYSAKELRPGLGAGSAGASIFRVGFQRSRQGMGNHGNGGRNRRLHYLQDLRGFIKGKHVPPLEELYALALSVREFCEEMGIGPKANFAGIAAALLRHPRFMRSPKKRIPEFINEKARIHLPGNHYDLFAEKGRVYRSASYHDQSAAHHHAALLAPTPHPNSVRAKGYTRDSDSGGGRVWITPEHPHWKTVLSEYGLFMVRAAIPAWEENEQRLVPHDLRVPGIRSVPVWSAELPWLEEMGISLQGVEWALSGNVIDQDIRRYAEWALQEASKRPQFKATLLCTYGLLASRRGWSRGIRGRGPKTVQWDAHTFKANVAIGTPEFHSYGPTNVLQRGIIEAYTRMLTLRFASSVPPNQQLGLYGDAVIINTEERDFIAPVGESPFREKGELTNVEFFSATQFQSDQLTRLPGVRAGMKR